MLAIFAFSRAGKITSPKLDELPTVATTASLAARRAHLAASLASALSSQTINSSFLPCKSPLALRLSTAARTPSTASGRGVALAVSVICPINISLMVSAGALDPTSLFFSLQPATRLTVAITAISRLTELHCEHGLLIPESWRDLNWQRLQTGRPPQGPLTDLVTLLRFLALPGAPD